MPKLSIIVGIGGSGKTHLCKKLAKEYNAFPFFDATLAIPDHRRAGFDCLGELVARLLGANQDCIMDESHLTHSSFREEFKKFCDNFLTGVEQDWIFFESDITSCINNVYQDYHSQTHPRQSLSRLKAVKDQGGKYVVPPLENYPGSRQLQAVYQQASPKFKSRDEAFTWLDREVIHLESKRN